MPPPKKAFDIEEEEPEEETYWLQNFVFDTSKVPHPTILLVGKRFSGKSYTAVSIAAKFNMPRWAAWCGTKDTEDFWAEKFESNASVRGPDEAGKSYLIKIIRYQQRKVRLYKKVLKQPFPREYTIGLIFDDVTSKRQFRKGEILEDLFSNGRHYKSVIIISCQYLKQLPPAVRLNTDYLFMMHNTKRTIQVLYDDYVEEPDEFNMFLDLIRSVTGQCDANGNDLYNSLVYDNVGKTSKLDAIFKIYRNEGSEIVDKMVLGDESWRNYNKAHFKDKDYELQKREYRKRKRLLRLQEYRQQQLERRQNPNNRLGNTLDLDYYSDSDSDEETHDSVTLTHKRGSAMTVNFSKKPKESEGGFSAENNTHWNLNVEQRKSGLELTRKTDMVNNQSGDTNTGYSIPNNVDIPLPPAEYRSGLYDTTPAAALYNNNNNNSFNPSVGHPYGTLNNSRPSSYPSYPPGSGYNSGYNNYSSPNSSFPANYGGTGYPSETSYAGYNGTNYPNYPKYSSPMASYSNTRNYTNPTQTQDNSGLNSWTAQQNFIRHNSKYVPTTNASSILNRQFI
jgi:hypothetical protein